MDEPAFENWVPDEVLRRGFLCLRCKHGIRQTVITHRGGTFHSERVISCPTTMQIIKVGSMAVSSCEAYEESR